MVLGIQIKKKWKLSYHQSDLFQLQVLILQFGGHWPINYGKILPKKWAGLSKLINIVYMTFVTFLNWHIAILYFVKFLKDSRSAEMVPIVEISDSLMSTILHLYAGFGSFYMQVYHEQCKRILKKMNERFLMRSAKGEWRNCFGDIDISFASPTR